MDGLRVREDKSPQDACCDGMVWMGMLYPGNGRYPVTPHLRYGQSETTSQPSHDVLGYYSPITTRTDDRGDGNMSEVGYKREVGKAKGQGCEETWTLSNNASSAPA